jgi:hypothetical protein
MKKILAITLAIAFGFLSVPYQSQAQVVANLSLAQSYNSLDAVTTGTGVYAGTIVGVPPVVWAGASTVCMATTLAGSPSAIVIDLQGSDTGADGDFLSVVSSTSTAGETTCARTDFRFYRAKQFSKTGGTTVTAAITANAVPPNRSISTIASATTIAPTGNIHVISGTTLITTITVPSWCSPTCQITLIPSGAFTTDASLNIKLASTAVVGKALIMTWDGTDWCPSY